MDNSRINVFERKLIEIKGDSIEKLILPKDYESPLNLHDTQLAIKTVKDFFQALLAQRLNLTRVSAPLFVDPETGLNDNLNGYERPVAFGIKDGIALFYAYGYRKRFGVNHCLHFLLDSRPFALCVYYGLV